tara:strand:- start:133 stop:333 length:201 start_codon:yes stop_codon:yes gene_type:complete
MKSFTASLTNSRASMMKRSEQLELIAEVTNPSMTRMEAWKASVVVGVDVPWEQFKRMWVDAKRLWK